MDEEGKNEVGNMGGFPLLWGAAIRAKMEKDG